MSRFKQYLHIIQEMKNILDNYDYDDDKIEIKIEKDTDTKKDTLKENIITLFFKKDENYQSSGNWIDFIKSKEIETKLNNLSIDIKLTEKISKYIIKYKEIDIKEQLKLKNNFVITITLLIFIGKEKLIEKFKELKKDYMFTEFDENENYIYLKTNNNDFLIITFESSDLEKFYCVYFDNNSKFREGESLQYEEYEGDKYKEKAYKDLLSLIDSEDENKIITANKEKIFKLNPIRTQD